MSIIDMVSIAIALISLIVSIYVVVRDKRNSQLELIMTMYDRLESANSELQTNQDEEISKKLKWRIDRELETACFMLYKNKIDKEIFYHLYKHWLFSRNMFWIDNKNDMAKPGNNPYTVWAIKNGLGKGYLNNTKREQKFLKGISDYIKNRRLS